MLKVLKLVHEWFETRCFTLLKEKKSEKNGSAGYRSRVTSLGRLYQPSVERSVLTITPPVLIYKTELKLQMIYLSYRICTNQLSPRRVLVLRGDYLTPTQ